MKKLIILGAGTAGTMMANKLRPALDQKEWKITLVDKDTTHYYQPGFLFIPFGNYSKKDVIKPKKNFFPEHTEAVFASIERIEPDKNRIILKNNRILDYDYLIIATGSEIKPDEIEGMVGPLWRKSIFDFYTLDGAVALRHFLETWRGGRLVINIAEMPIKCPVAPLEFAFLADAFLTKKGLRNNVEIDFVTPLSGAFTKPVASARLGDLLEEKNINLISDFNIGEVDNDRKCILSWDEREVPFDLLVTIPTNMGNEAIARSGIGDELNFIPTDKHTLLAKNRDNIFVMGDATDLPASKAGSVAHFEADILGENFMDIINDREPRAQFDGHANCFIESSFNRGFLIDFNYEVEPLPGMFPLPGIGPFSLLQESRMNHMGKMAFRWIYWNMLIKGKKLPFVDAHMSMKGKNKPKNVAVTL